MILKIWTPILMAMALIGFAEGMQPQPAYDARGNATMHPEDPKQYGSFYTKSCDLIAPEYPIHFTHDAVPHTKGIELIPDSGDILIKEPGIYRVIYGVSLAAAGGNVALTLDDHLIPGSEQYIGICDQMSTVSLLIRVCSKHCCDHTLRVINNFYGSTGWYTHDINLQAGPDQKNVSAFVEIERVGECWESCCCK